MLRVYLICPLSRHFATLRLAGENQNIRMVTLKEVTRSDTSILYVTEMNEPFYFSDGGGDLLELVALPDDPCFIYECWGNNGNTECADIFPDHVISHPTLYTSSESGYTDMMIEMHFVIEDDV